MNKKRILFVSGTRADFGKIRALIDGMLAHSCFCVKIFVTGMHLNREFGLTLQEIANRYPSENIICARQENSQSMSSALGMLICEMSEYITDFKPDMIIVHGDRLEALGGAIVGAMNNILVAHIEGGEVSGTIDESIRHSISKLAHIHFVSNVQAKNRLIQLGEEKNRIFITGSPDIDIMLNLKSVDLDCIKKRYHITFDKYSIFIFHPVTTELDQIQVSINNVIKALIMSGLNYIVIYPNNDTGHQIILHELEGLNANNNFLLFPSIPLDDFLHLLYHCDFIIGNSSAGIRESGVYGIPAIDIGTRQNNRSKLKNGNIQHVGDKIEEILHAIENIDNYRIQSFEFGDGHSCERFIHALLDESIWNIGKQKRVIDINE